MHFEGVKKYSTHAQTCPPFGGGERTLVRALNISSGQSEGLGIVCLSHFVAIETKPKCLPGKPILKINF